MNKKGFTLIELLAVIIIIAVVGLIAIPSISGTIDNSRRKAYIDIANAYVDAVRNKIASREFVIPKTGVTYYIPIDSIHIEGGVKQSPYGEWASFESDIKYVALDKDDVGNCSGVSGTNAITASSSDPFKVYNQKYLAFDSEKTYTSAKQGCIKGDTFADAYVIVVFNKVRNRYEYYWASRDVTGHKIYPSIIDNLSESDIVLNDNPIGTFVSVDKYVVKVSNEGNPTSGKKYAFSEFNARTFGNANKVGFYMPDKTFGLGSSIYDMEAQEAALCFKYETKADGTIKITWYNPDCSDQVIIPSKIDGKTVTEIGAYAFRDCGITSVVIPDSVTTIGSRAFYSNSISEVIFPTTSVTINSEAFSNNQLTEINVPSNATLSGGPFTNNQVPEENAYIYKTYPDGSKDYRTLIGYAGTSDIINIPPEREGVALLTIGEAAFRGAKKSSITIPDTVTRIENWAFASNNLTSFTYPSHLTYIGYAAFANNQLTTTKNIPSTVTSIGGRSYNGNKVADGSEYVYARDASGINYSTIVSYAGKNKSITIPPTQGPDNTPLKSIVSAAFFGCGLQKINNGIPNSVTSIGTKAFNSNSISDANNPWIYGRKSTGGEDKTVVIGYGGSNKNITIPSTVKVIKSYALSETGIKSVVIPEGVTTIEANALRQSYLTDVIIPSSVTSIGDGAFCKEVSWADFNRYSRIVNKTGKAFNWKGITCSSLTPLNAATGVQPHQVESDIQVVDH